jgi:hypothetical protein
MTMANAIERRLRALERLLALEDYDAPAIWRQALEAYEQGRPLPRQLAGDGLALACLDLLERSEPDDTESTA